MAGPRILIVDDEQIARENLEHVLRREGYETLSVSDGLAAIGETRKGRVRSGVDRMGCLQLLLRGQRF
jgi:ATP-dependent Lon protease